jgi:uncharacterized membrane protein YccC
VHRLWRRLVGTDPAHQALRRASRVAVVTTAMMVLGLAVLDAPTFATFGLFGAFALLGFADFQGTPLNRSRAYLTVTAVGALLIIVGTVVSTHLAAAVAVVAIVGFAVRFLGSFGGPWYGAESPVILAYVLAATVPGDAGAIPARLAGWSLAGALATLAALVPWPRSRHGEIVDRALALCDVLSSMLREWEPPGTAGPPVEARARDLDAALEATMLAPARPAGPGIRDAATRLLVDELRRLCRLLFDAPGSDGPWPPTAIEFAGFCADALGAASAALRGEPEEMTIDTLAAARSRLVEKQNEWVTTEADASQSAREVVAALDAAFPLRFAASLALSVYANALIVRYGRLPTMTLAAADVETPSGFRGRMMILLSAHGRLDSPYVQDSIRAAVALALAVFLALRLSLDHGFWVVLGTLSVLRSNAFATGSNAVRAALGTAVGFGATSVFFAVVGLDRWALWVLAIGALFFAAYAPQAYGFLAGQVAFTVAVVSAFNLIKPQGWKTGLVRFEDIAIGAAVSLVVAFVFWPRRADRPLRAAMGRAYEALGPAIVGAIDAIASGGGTLDGAVAVATRSAERQARAAFVVFVDESRRASVQSTCWDRCLGVVAQLRAGCIIAPAAIKPYQLGAEGRLETLHAAAATLAGELGLEAAAIREATRPGPVMGAPELAERTAPAVVEVLRHCISAGGSVRAGVAAVWAREWLLEAAALTEQAAAAIVAANAGRKAGPSRSA